MIKLIDKEEISPGKGKVITLPNGKEIAVFNINGSFFALENECPHMGGPLGEGEIEGCTVTCPWHGWQFDIKTGACENVPGDDASKINLIINDDGIFLDD